MELKEEINYLLLLKEGYNDREIAKLCHTSKSKVSFWYCIFKKLLAYQIIDPRV